MYGDFATLLTIMKGISLAYIRDMQEDEEPVSDATDTVKMVLLVYGPMITSIPVKETPYSVLSLGLSG